MAEVENQIRFSATAELLERIAACPAIEQCPDIGTDHHRRKFSSPAKLSSPVILSGSSGCLPPTPPPVPDLLQAIEEPHDSPLNLPGNRRYTSLPRPSDMPSAPTFTPAGIKVPDMLSRVNCGHENLANNNYSNIESVREDLTKVRNDIDNLRESLTETKSNVQANSRDILARCSFYTDGDVRGKEIKGKSDSMENDLKETNNAMKEIERTVNSFRTQTSLPTGSTIEARNSPNPRRVGIFAGANQGSVTKTKDRFEARSLESRIPVPRQRGNTPFSSKTRSPSPATLREKNRHMSIGNGETVENGSTSNFRSRSGTGTRMNL